MKILRVNEVSTSISRGLDVFVLAVSAVVLAGWFFESEVCKRIIPGLVAMNPATAVSFILLAASVLLILTGKRHMLATVFLCTLVLMIALTILIAYAVPIPFRFDQILFPSKLEGNVMAPNTAIAFIFLAVSHLCYLSANRLFRKIAQTSAFLSVILAFTAVVGYTLSVRIFYSVPNFIPMALNTALCFLAAGFATLLLPVNRELLSPLSSRFAGGMMARRLIPAMLFVTFTFGYLQLQGQQRGWFGIEFGTALNVTANMFFFLLLIYVNAKILNRSDRASKKADLKLHRFNWVLESKVEQRTAELQKVQRQIVQQERLRALGEMASGIAHDFNNSLAPILGYSEMLDTSPESIPGDKRREFIKLIYKSAKDATEIVKRLRYFGRSKDAGADFAPVDLHEIIRDTIELTKPKWKTAAMSRSVDIQVIQDLQPVPNVMGNEQQIREAITNLIFNAVDALKTSGSLIFRTYAKEGKAVVEVSDTGIGMSDEIRQKCLEPFFTTKGEHGTGLGLSMVYGIIQKHGGTLDIQTKLGKGTSFIIALPAGTESLSAVRTQTQEPHCPKTLRILYVEDEKDVQNAMVEYLKQAGHFVEAAENGMQGLEKYYANKSGFDVVITDQAMPQMSGEQMAYAIRRLSPKQKIIHLSGTAHVDEVAPVFDESLAKPVTVEDLCKALKKLFP